MNPTGRLLGFQWGDCKALHIEWIPSQRPRSRPMPLRFGQPSATASPLLCPCADHRLLVRIAALGWAYLGYPALVFILARSRPVILRPTQPAPTLSVAIAVHDEEGHIAERIDDVLAQAASGAQIAEVLVGSDGSTDASDQITRPAPSPFTLNPFELFGLVREPREVG